MKMRRTSLLHRLIYGRSIELRSYETLVIKTVCEHLPQSTAAKLEAQLQDLPFRQRHSDDRVIAFFPDDGIKFPSQLLFDNRQDDLEFAIVELYSPSTEGVLTARLMAAVGFFFSLEFDDSPRTRGIVDGGQVMIAEVKITVQLDESQGDVISPN